jgi:hypothetical protein
MQKRHQFSIIGKAVNEPPPLTIGFNESGKSFMFLAIPSSAITLQARSNKRLCKKTSQDMLHVPGLLNKRETSR